MVLILTRSDLERAITMKDAIEATESAFAELAQGTARLPPRSIINIEKENGVFLVMPAYLATSKSLVVKVVSVFEQNPAKYGMSTISAIVIVNDPDTGRPLAVMEGGYLTASRTAAASAVATKYLARPNSKIVGVIGAGVQSRKQLLAVSEVRDFEEALVYDISPQRSQNYATEMSEKLGIDVVKVENVESAVTNTDILIVATTSRQPVVRGVWIKNGTHINSIGWMGPSARELDTDVVKKSKLIVDSMDATLSESGDIIIPIAEGAITRDHIYSELGRIIIGEKKGRTSDDEITLWKSVGLAIQDAAVAKLAYERAISEKLGIEVELG